MAYTTRSSTPFLVTVKKNNQCDLSNILSNKKKKNVFAAKLDLELDGLADPHEYHFRL